MFGNIPLLHILGKSGPTSLATLFVMALLSVGIWAILFKKWNENKKKKAFFKKWKSSLGSQPTLQEIAKLTKAMPESPFGRIAQAGLKEMESLSPYVSYDSLPHRAQLVLDAVERNLDAEKEINDKFLTYLAFCSATGPLLGLLGTVWGIINAFYEIGQQGSANITVVAPGIAEALVATLGGLFVAIPGSIGYNFFVSFNRNAESSMFSFGSELVSMFKRVDLGVLEKNAK